jgi:hypothetical protein
MGQFRLAAVPPVGSTVPPRRPPGGSAPPRRDLPPRVFRRIDDDPQPLTRAGPRARGPGPAPTDAEVPAAAPAGAFRSPGPPTGRVTREPLRRTVAAGPTRRLGHHPLSPDDPRLAA